MGNPPKGKSWAGLNNTPPPTNHSNKKPVFRCFLEGFLGVFPFLYLVGIATDLLLVDHPILHYEDDPLRVMNIFERVASDRDDVGPLAHSQRAEVLVPTQ